MIVPKTIYYRIYVILLLLLGATVGVAYLHLGAFNVLAAMTIAVTKMVLVVLYFMHVRYSTRLTWVIVVAGFFWLLIFIALTMSDYLSRQ